jgi:hypothetical protein
MKVSRGDTGRAVLHYLTVIRCEGRYRRRDCLHALATEGDDDENADQDSNSTWMFPASMCVSSGLAIHWIKGFTLSLIERTRISRSSEGRGSLFDKQKQQRRMML